jgi:hypothetical protein
MYPTDPFSSLAPTIAMLLGLKILSRLVVTMIELYYEIIV